MCGCFCGGITFEVDNDEVDNETYGHKSIFSEIPDDPMGEVKAIWLELSKINTPWRGPDFNGFRGMRLEVPFEITSSLEITYKDQRKKKSEDRAIGVRTTVVNDLEYEYLPFFIYNVWSKK